MIKHKVLSDYFDKWVKIIGKNHTLTCVDGFGGKGVYKDKNENIYFGSPILIAEILENNKHIIKKGAKLIIIEKEYENIENLKKVFIKNNLKINPIYLNKDFIS